MRFVPSPVASEPARTLLTEYFEGRERSFPSAQGTYRTTFPDPAQFVPPAGVFLVVADDGDAGDVNAPDPSVAIGCGGIRRIADDEDGSVRFEVKHLYLRPAARGRGIGRLLLAELERRAADFGASVVVLDTNASLEAAGGLYRSSGYVDVPPFNDNPNATNWYAKRLAP
ncbi:GNAT family N-acetyltransferase [Planctomonas psychrotolerans]|uniref:GNAT family N-acetyltransferase n=1 Tax=Planctomonas psychrotolerans TaxID=2528712 RepID=UPI001238F2A2|nr:GNAT family N-acetyltransferase [Planctomonas psychrotolerans]